MSAMSRESHHRSCFAVFMFFPVPCFVLWRLVAMLSHSRTCAFFSTSEILQLFFLRTLDLSDNTQLTTLANVVFPASLTCVALAFLCLPELPSSSAIHFISMARIFTSIVISCPIVLFRASVEAPCFSKTLVGIDTRVDADLQDSGFVRSHWTDNARQRRVPHVAHVSRIPSSPMPAFDVCKQFHHQRLWLSST
jgi:hypothetical protein